MASLRVALPFYNEIVDGLSANSLPFLYERTETGAPDPRSWCAGYIRGVAVASHEWLPLFGNGGPFQALLAPIRTIAETAPYFRDARSLNALRTALPESVAAIRDVWADRIVVAPLRRDEPKVSRNSPCPCGSGKKYNAAVFRRNGVAESRSGRKV